MTIAQFRQKILRSYKNHRRTMPWRTTRDPYKILVSEVMLQQTQVSRVLLKYRKFLETFPTLRALAKARTRKLLRLWQGLGYWRRAIFLRQTARIILKNYKGHFPRDPKILETLPGVGPYTARAVACFAFNHPKAFIDTNIRRVYLHFFFQRKKQVSDKKILALAQKALWRKNPRVWHYALFDYGARMLQDKTINQQSRHYHRQTKFEMSFRWFRTKIIKFLLTQKQCQSHIKEIRAFLKKESARLPYPLSHILMSLVHDKILTKCIMQETYCTL